MNLGTIFTTDAELKTMDAHADRMTARSDKIARKQLAHCTRRVVGGEVRYYDTTDQYAIVSRQGAILWFAVRADGDYRI